MRPLFTSLLMTCGITIGMVSAQPQALEVRSGETASDIIVSFSNPVIVSGTAAKGVMVAGADLTVRGRVQGDVAVISGRLIVKDGGIINGNIVLIGSEQEISQDAKITGKTVTAPFLGTESRRIFNNPAAYLFSVDYSSISIAKGIFSSLIWFILSILLVKFFPAHIGFACSRIKKDPGYIVGIGIIGAFGLLVLLVISILLCLVYVGFLLVFLLIVFTLTVWIFGMVTLLFFAGEKAAHLLHQEQPKPMTSLLLAVLLWTVFKFIPGVSLLVHLAAFVMSLGVTISTRFGTGTPWIRRRPAPAGAER